jgi:hypothetical protein
MREALSGIKFHNQQESIQKINIEHFVSFHYFVLVFEICPPNAILPRF